MTGEATRTAAAKPADILQRVYIQTRPDLDVSVHSKTRTEILIDPRIFVPCREGISHNPAEYCSPEDCGNGAQTLLGAILRYDRLRAEKGA
jgi:acetylornithine deacetylase/succinyl-diaminopimelate desuccinylase-like protein